MELKPRTRKEFLIADFIDKDTPDIVPKTRSEMFLKQMLDKSSKPSWNDLTDKPFGEEVSVKETFPVQEITFDDEGGCSLETDFEKPEIGQECIVTLDGVEYTCVAWDCMAAAAVGNGALIGFEPETDYPFFLEFNRCVIMAPEFAGKTVSFGIKIVSETIKTIDPKYLPEGSGGGGVYAVIERQGSEYALYLNDESEEMFAPSLALADGFITILMDGLACSQMLSASLPGDGTIVMFFFDPVTGNKLTLVYGEDGTIEAINEVG